MSEQTQQTEEKSRVYTIARRVVGVLLRLLFPIRYHGLENLPGPGSSIVICNHIQLTDPVLVAYAVKNREITFLAKKELGGNPLMKWLMDKLHVILVDRHNSDMEAMRSCVKTVRAGHILGIFPEGTRHHQGTMTEMETGTAMIALRCNVPLIPFYISGKLRMFRPTHVYVGQPITFADLKAEGVSNETCRALMERITHYYEGMIADHQKLLGAGK